MWVESGNCVTDKARAHGARSPGQEAIPTDADGCEACICCVLMLGPSFPRSHELKWSFGRVTLASDAIVPWELRFGSAQA